MIDPALAPKEALMVLYRGDTDRVNALLRSRETVSFGDTGPSPGIVNPGLPLAGAAFAVDAQTQIGHRIYQRTTVVLLTGVQSRPYLILARSS